jgi:hypothetical protein
MWWGYDIWWGLSRRSSATPLHTVAKILALEALPHTSAGGSNLALASLGGEVCQTRYE